MTPEDIVRNYWTYVWVDRDLSVLGDYYTDPTIRHTVEGSQTLSVADLAKQLTNGLRAIRGESFSIDALTVVDDVAWVRLTLRGISLAVMTPMTYTWLAQYRIADGKIAETWALHRADVDWTT
jgi:hypothetical protein